MTLFPSNSPKGEHKLRLRWQISYNMGGQVADVLGQTAVLAALAHFRGPSEVGHFGMALAITTPFFKFAGVGGKDSQISDVTQRFSFAEYAGLVVMLALLATTASIFSGYFLADTLSTFFIVLVVSGTKFFEAISTLSYGAFQQAGHNDKPALSLALRSILTASLFALLLYIGASIAVAFLAQFLARATLAILRDYPLAARTAQGRIIWPSGNFRRIWILAVETAPLGASYVVNSMAGSLPRLVVGNTLGLVAVGLLTVATYIQQGATIIINAIAEVTVNHFARYRHEGKSHAVRRLVVQLLGIAVVGSVAGVAFTLLFGPRLLQILFGSQFLNAQPLLVFVALALAVKLFSLIPQSLLHADRRFKSMLVRELAAVAVCFVLLLWLVPWLGLIGAGIAIFGTTLARFVIMMAATVGRTSSGTTKVPPGFVPDVDGL